MGQNQTSRRGNEKRKQQRYPHNGIKDIDRSGYFAFRLADDKQPVQFFQDRITQNLFIAVKLIGNRVGTERFLISKILG